MNELCKYTDLVGRHVKAKPANVELVAKYESSKALQTVWAIPGP
jgi:hypothetical protein